MILVAAAFLPAEGTGQGISERELTVGCAGCQIIFDTIAILGDSEGPGMIPSEAVAIAVDERGVYHVMSEEARSIQLFSEEGRFLTRLGQRGDGPGEFQWPRALSVNDGELFVVDRLQFRLTVFGRDLEVDRTVRIEGVVPGFGVFPLRGDSLLLSGYSTRPGLFGMGAHVIGPDGRRVRSCGAPDGPIMAEAPNRVERRLAVENSGNVWIASQQEYRIELWNMSGRRLSTLSTNEWFEPETPPAESPSPPRAQLVSLQQDAEGLLWVQLSVPGDEWWRAVVRDRSQPHGWRTVDRQLWTERLFDVIDPESGRLFARRQSPGRFTRLFGTSEALVGRAELDMDRGLVRMVILRMRLEGIEPGAG